MANYKIGDKLIWHGDNGKYFTAGRTYIIHAIKYGELVVLDDKDGEHYLTPGYARTNFELVESAQPTPDVTELPSVEGLIANLARRVSELEACLSVEQAHRADLTAQNAQQAYEINELYKAVARL